MVQLSHPYMTTGKTIALIRWAFVGKVVSLLFNMLSRLVIAFLQRSKCLLTWGLNGILFLKSYYLFIFGCARSLWLSRLSPVGTNGGCSLAAVLGLLTGWPLLLWSMGLWAWRLFNGCGSQAPEIRLISCGTWAAPQPVGSSLTREQIGIPCIAKMILNYWTTREAPNDILKRRERDTRDLWAQRRGQVRTQGEGDCLQAWKRSLIRNQPWRHLISDCQLPEMWENKLVV